MNYPEVGIVVLLLVSAALGGAFWKLVKEWKNWYDDND